MKEHILLEKAFRYTEPMHIEPPAGYAINRSVDIGQALIQAKP